MTQEMSLSVSGEMHWIAPAPPMAHRVDFITQGPLADTGEGVRILCDALHSAARPAVHRIVVASAKLKVVSMQVKTPKLKLRTFEFPESVSQSALTPNQEPQAPGRGALTGANAGDAAQVELTGITRIHPPKDIVKLYDRLQYILQPSLESLAAERALSFPFRPFPFQFEGVAFLYPREAAVLADEMGLGKTMQAITAIRMLLHSGEVRSILLICPKPLVTNWQREFAQWAPEVPVMAIEGDQTKRTWQWQLPDVPLRIANYELVYRDREVFESRLTSQGASQLHFDLVVLDESQRIKNRGGTTSMVVRSIARKRSWALTGTPVENSAEDLVGIFEFLAPGFLTSDMKPRKMGRMVSDYVLRRTKDQVLQDMPPKLIHDTEIELTAEQRETYRMAEDEGVVRLTKLGDSAMIQHVFELVIRLKQICNFDPATLSSAKLERLEADLEEIAFSGRKALVFSQWVDTLQKLSRHLKRFNPLEYHGKIPSAKRDGVIQRFREDPKSHVLLMSYGAGGVGLNLQFANYVFLFDRWWNPAMEDQAINRAHRIGATGAVTVERFLTVDTIEQRIDQILREKRELFATIFSDHEGPSKQGLTQEDLFGLFRLRCPNGTINVAAA